MAYIVMDNCKKCKFTDCVEVCPVDCFYELKDQLVIDPEECIDCGACEPECPVEAISDESEISDEQVHSIAFNAEQSAQLKENGVDPIIERKDPLPTAEERREELGL